MLWTLFIVGLLGETGLIFSTVCLQCAAGQQAPSNLMQQAGSVFNMLGLRVILSVMTFASLYLPVIAFFENIIFSFIMDLKGWDREKALNNLVGVLVTSMPCVLGL